MKALRIAINENTSIFNHSTSWVHPWIDFCRSNNIAFEIVNCYQFDILQHLQAFDILLWHVNGYVLQDMLIARSIVYSASNIGLKVFPDINTLWHFDDKLAETYLLQSVGAPVPQSWMFYSLKDCANWIESNSTYPYIAKLRCGSGASNVVLLRSKHEALAYSRKMFGSGMKMYPSFVFKAKSNLVSAKSWDMIRKRLQRIPDFVESLTKAYRFPREKDYVLFQEFVPNEGYDLKIVVVGDKLSFVARYVRKGDFRASGGGDLFYDKNLVTPAIRATAFEITKKLGFQSMGYDFVIDKRTREAKIVEMSYGFSHSAIIQAGGYWTTSGDWITSPLNVPQEIIKNMLSEK